MITAVDSNVLLDVFQDDPRFGRTSSEAMRQCFREGRLVVCDVVWAELAAVFPSSPMLEEYMDHLEIALLPLEVEAASLAGDVWREYRARGGAEKRVIADFLVAAHAQVQCNRLLTRDRGFYREYFSSLSLVGPMGTQLT